MLDFDKLPDNLEYLEYEDDDIYAVDRSFNLFRVSAEGIIPTKSLTFADMAYNSSVISKEEASKLLKEDAAAIAKLRQPER